MGFLPRKFKGEELQPILEKAMHHSTLHEGDKSICVRAQGILYPFQIKDILYIEVGATCVGTIKQTYSPNTKVLKGSEKGYFKFGGSTVILFLEKNKIKIDSDILSETKKNIETKVKMGETIGIKL